ncbi:MAG: hypothetical protein V3R79_06485, partial [Alphaproteobacteria bacterium]
MRRAEYHSTRRRAAANGDHAGHLDCQEEGRRSMFKALVLTEGDGAVSSEIKDLDETELPD